MPRIAPITARSDLPAEHPAVADTVVKVSKIVGNRAGFSAPNFAGQVQIAQSLYDTAPGATAAHARACINP